MSKRNKDQHKAYLRQLSDRRKATQGVPNFGINEEKIAHMALQLKDLVDSNNRMVKTIDDLKKNNVVEKCLEAHYMMSTILSILVSKKICTEQDIQSIAESIQMDDLGLVEKENKIAEPGDHMMIKFKIFDGDTLVDDQSATPLAYVVGSKGLPCDDGLQGMAVGENRLLDVTFGKGFKFQQYVGKPLRMQVSCVGVKTKKPAAQAAQPTL
jgi:hypothetical protein